MADEVDVQLVLVPNASDGEGVQAQHEELIRQLRTGELRGRVKVILILGFAGAGKSNFLKLLTGAAIRVGHGPQTGTVDALCQLVAIGGEQFVIIDTPGFGTTGYSASKVRNTIMATLGFATRCFGGLHGILYLHNIEADRTYTGITESLDLLHDLKRNHALPHITFVSTKWDRVPEYERQIFEDKIENLENTTWAEFPDHGYIKFGCNYDHSPTERRLAAKAQLENQLARLYGGAEVVPVTMPFWQWTWGELGGTAAVRVGAAAVGAGTLYGVYLALPVLVPLALGVVVIEALSQGIKDGVITIGIGVTI